MKTHRYYVSIPPVSRLGISRLNSRIVYVILEARAHSPAEHTNSCCSEKYSANRDVTEKGAREGGGVGGLKGDQGRARNRCSDIQCWLSRLMLQDGLRVYSDAHFHSGVLDSTLAQVLPHIPGFPP